MNVVDVPVANDDHRTRREGEQTMETSTRARVHMRRYRRGLTTIPLILLTSVVAWAMAGGGDFWPKWVMLWAVVAMTLRASLAMHVDSDSD